MSIIDDAVQLGLQGYPVFPCMADKRPACPHGFHDAKLGAADIEDLFRAYRGQLIGVATGVICDALDIDAKHDAARAWWGQHRSAVLVPTRVHRTWSGGLHVLFRANAAVKCSAGQICTGVDTRGFGGYIIWWPAADCPVLLDAPLAPWPQWLLEALRPKLPQRPKQTNNVVWIFRDAWLRGLARTVVAAAEGQRNSILFWAACRAAEALRSGKATDEGFVTDVLVEAASRAGLTEREARQTIKSAMRGRP